jgi:N-acetylmuramoyl-L-alanine amidase
VPTFALRAPNGLLIIRAYDQVAYWNGLEFHLGFAPQVLNGQPVLHSLDFTKNIEPLMHSLALPERTNRLIVIDAGHGGSNLGTKSVVDGSYEKEFSLDWARRLASILETNGWKVLLTRTSDVDISLTNRVTFADMNKASLFISLHFNAAPSPTDHDEAGIETFCVTPTGMPSTLKRDWEDDATLVFPNNRFDAENLQYAMQVQRSLLKISGAKDHGVRRARFMTVIRGQNCPAILVEGGYLSNPREARRIADPSYRQKLAEAVAAALIEKVTTPAPQTTAENNTPPTNSVPKQ